MLPKTFKGRSGKKRPRDGAEEYWAREMKDGKLALSYLERQVFSWSVEDIFNRDLLRHKVGHSSIASRFKFYFSCVFCFHFFGRTGADTS